MAVFRAWHGTPTQRMRPGTRTSWTKFGCWLYPVLLIGLTCLAHWQIHHLLTADDRARTEHSTLLDSGQRQLTDHGFSSLAARKALAHAYGRMDADSGTKQPTIFVSIAAYRDDECKDTLNDMFAKASHPRRIQVGVCQQIRSSDELCWNTTMQRSKQVKIATIPYFAGKGPCYARYVASTLYQGEDFYLQLDSHMRFGEGWDQALIDMVLSSSDQRAVFSHYPHDMAQMSSTAPRTNDVPRMCDAYFDEATGFPFFKTVQQHMQPGDHRPAAFTAAGMLFARADILAEVPFDPELDLVFIGEEILYSARLWTHGWNLYTPDKNICWHHYNRSTRPNVWGDIPGWYERQSVGNARVRYLLDMVPDLPNGQSQASLDYYGMGYKRTLAEYWQYAGLDVKERRTWTREKYCA
ncbi:hypothetical protein WJX84_012169 [Apatococcus fuscideae]|uniref:Uncharacterized protein n=1 Tax=Apatococcus fuscideae TaxID=2026836 RepID=A0AAW1TL18_9CHLO